MRWRLAAPRSGESIDTLESPESNLEICRRYPKISLIREPVDWTAYSTALVGCGTDSVFINAATGFTSRISDLHRLSFAHAGRHEKLGQACLTYAIRCSNAGKRMIVGQGINDE